MGDVLLIQDVLEVVMEMLRLEDRAANAVCKLWSKVWKATFKGRGCLVNVAFDFPQHLLNKEDLLMTVIPGNEQQLVVVPDVDVNILDRHMNSVTSTDLSFLYFSRDGLRAGHLAASEEFVYATGGKRQDTIVSLTHDLMEGSDDLRVAEWNAQNKCIDFPVHAPGERLFCVLYDRAGREPDEIVALNAQTLQPLYLFGQSMFKDARGMVVVGEELFVCDNGNNRLQVFSLAGEHRRSITGEWERPHMLCFLKDRLYLLVDELTNPEWGRRIFVLSLQGDTLQVYRHPVEGQFFDGLYCFDGKLLAPLVVEEGEEDEEGDELSFDGEHVGVVALRDLRWGATAA